MQAVAPEEAGERLAVGRAAGLCEAMVQEVGRHVLGKEHQVCLAIC